MTGQKEIVAMMNTLRSRGDSVATKGWGAQLFSTCAELESSGLTDFGGVDVLLHHLGNLASECNRLGDKWAERDCKKSGRICRSCRWRPRSAMEITSYVAQLRSEKLSERAGVGS